jgi:hypothetical protein
MRWLSGGVAVLAVCSVAGASSGRNLTPFGEQDSLIAQMDQPLDAAGVDVRSTYARLSLASTRPVLAPLRALPLQPPSVPWPGVERDFKRGALGFALAWAGLPGPSSPTLQSTRAAWAAAPAERRIFLSFTRADRKWALEVRKVLEAAGYAVFTYLPDQDGGPPFTVEEVGKLFREAGRRYVVDTPNARKSTGVWIERSVQEDFRRQETIEDAIRRLKADDGNLRRWRGQHTPFLAVDDRIHAATAPLVESLVRRAAALDALLAAVAEKNDPRRQYLAGVRSEGWRHLVDRPDRLPLATDDIPAEAARFRHELGQLKRDRKRFPVVSPLGLTAEPPGLPPGGRLTIIPKPPEFDFKKVLDDQMERQRREAAEFPRRDSRTSPEDRERARERMERAREGPRK